MCIVFFFDTDTVWRVKYLLISGSVTASVSFKLSRVSYGFQIPFLPTFTLNSVNRYTFDAVLWLKFEAFLIEL